MSKFSILFVAMCLIGAHAIANAEHNVIVNNHRLSDSILASMEQHYGVRVPSGRHWYDTVSGLWGHESGPAAGRMKPGHNLGRLRSDASGGYTNVLINGRRIHPAELDFLRACFGHVNPGKYWLRSNGIGGYVGGPGQFDVAACFRGGGGGRSESLLGGYFLAGVSVLGN